MKKFLFITIFISQLLGANFLIAADSPFGDLGPQGPQTETTPIDNSGAKKERVDLPYKPTTLENKTQTNPSGNEGSTISQILNETTEKNIPFISSKRATIVGAEVNRPQ